MRQNPTRLRKRYPSFYRHDLLDWQRKNRGWNQRQTAREAKIHIETIKKVLKGKATGAKVYAVATVLGIDWMQLHNLALPKSDFHLALTNGNSRKAG